MQLRLCSLVSLQVSLLASVACNDSPPHEADLGVHVDLGRPLDLTVDAAVQANVDAAVDQSAMNLGPIPGALDGLTVYLSGKDVLDASTDGGGGIWAVTSAQIYYFPSGHNEPFAYDQSKGLARGWATWTDAYFDPGVHPVTFSAVAGGVAGEAVIGNIGAIADRLMVDPATGGVLRVDNMQVTASQVKAAELPEHMKRVVAVWSVVADPSGTLQGTAYLGGYHGFYAFHGIGGDCTCLPFEEHQHYINDVLVAGGDVRALALTHDGDLWAGDREVVQLLPQRSRGERVGFFDYPISVAIDVWPGTKDEIWGLAVDSADGLYVASNQNGLAYLDPASQKPTQVSLPESSLTGVAIDGDGDVWVGTQAAGVLRLRPSSGATKEYQGELPSGHVHRVQIDRYSSTRRLLISTKKGLAVYSGP